METTIMGDIGVIYRVYIGVILGKWKRKWKHQGKFCMGSHTFTIRLSPATVLAGSPGPLQRVLISF